MEHFVYIYIYIPINFYIHMYISICTYVYICAEIFIVLMEEIRPNQDVRINHQRGSRVFGFRWSNAGDFDADFLLLQPCKLLKIRVVCKDHYSGYSSTQLCCETRVFFPFNHGS